MGDIADDCFDRAMDELADGRAYEDDDGYYYSRQRFAHTPSGSRKKQAKKQKAMRSIAQEYPSKTTPSHLLRDHPEKTFDMSSFPTNIPKPRTVVPEEPKEQPAADPWDTTGEEAPF